MRHIGSFVTWFVLSQAAAAHGASSDIAAAAAAFLDTLEAETRTATVHALRDDKRLSLIHI